MDALEQDDVAQSQATPPAVKLKQALELMATGFRLQQAKLRQQHPQATEAELEELFLAWLARED